MDPKGQKKGAACCFFQSKGFLQLQCPGCNGERSGAVIARAVVPLTHGPHGAWVYTSVAQLHVQLLHRILVRMQCMLNASARSSFALHVLQPTLPSKQRAFEMHRRGCQGARERGGVVNHLLKFRSVLPLLLRFGRPQKMHMVNRDGLIAA